MKFIVIFFLSLSITVTVVAQEECSEFVSDAMDTIDAICDATSRNELCYGQSQVDITPPDDARFSQSGDIVSIQNVETIETSPYNNLDDWGIALMRVQANIPDSIPGQSVTFLLYGDVELQNASSSPPIVPASTTGSINIRSGPSTNFAVAGSLQASTTIDLVGRNTEGDWVYFTTDDNSGWLFASLLQIDGDITSLDIVPDDFEGVSNARPMQAVYFQSGITNNTCDNLPRDGLLIQSPQGSGPVALTINDVQLVLGSTVFIQAEADHAMFIYVLEGFVYVTANGGTVNVPAGGFTKVGLDENLRAIDSPSTPEAYTDDTVSSVPVEVLDVAIEIAEPASEDILEAASTEGVIGSWGGTQADGNVVRITVASIDSDTYWVNGSGTLSSPDSPCAGGPYTFSQEFTLTDTGLTGAFDIVCANGTTLSNPTEFVYDPDADTLSVAGFAMQRQ